MTTTVAGVPTAVGPRTRNAAHRSRWQQWRASRAARSTELDIRRHERENHSDRYIDHFGSPPPPDVLAVMLQR